MAIYNKLLRIQYHNKIFDVFSDKNHHRSFLEVKINHQEEQYYYPQLTDYVFLNSIYNPIPNGILAAKKYSFQQRVFLGGFCLFITPLFFPLVTSKDINIHLNHLNISSEAKFHLENSTDESFFEETNYLHTLSQYGLSSVTFDDIKNTISSNLNIGSNYQEYLSIFLKRLEERAPFMELRILNENLKTLKFETLSNEDWLYSDIDAYYDSDTNTIYLKEQYETEEYKKTILFHELGHLLNNISLEMNGEIIHSNYYQYYNNYGKSLSEGFDTVFTDYLITDDPETYFQKPYRSYSNYSNTAAICYQIIKLLNYDLATYSQDNILDLENRLKEENLNDLIDALDANLETNDASEITISDEDLLRETLTKLLQKRVQQELKEGMSLLESYSFSILFLNQFQNNYNDYYLSKSYMELFQICNQQHSSEDSSFVILDNMDFDHPDSNFKLKKDGKIVVEKQLDKLFFNPIIEDGMVRMKIYYLEEKNGWHAFDVETNQEIDFLHTISIPLTSYLNTLLPISFSQYRVEIDAKFFQSREFYQFIEKELKLELEKEKNSNQMLTVSLTEKNYCDDLPYPKTLEECKEQILKNRIFEMYDIGYHEINIIEMIQNFPLEDMIKYQIKTPGIYHITGLSNYKIDREITDGDAYLAGTAKIFAKNGKATAYQPNFLLYPVMEDEQVIFHHCVLEAVDRNENGELVFEPFDVVTGKKVDENAPCLSLEKFLTELWKKYSRFDTKPSDYNLKIDISFLETRDLSKIMIKELGDLLTQYDPVQKETEKQK